MQKLHLSPRLTLEMRQGNAGEGKHVPPPSPHHHEVISGVCFVLWAGDPAPAAHDQHAHRVLHDGLQCQVRPRGASWPGPQRSTRSFHRQQREVPNSDADRQNLHFCFIRCPLLPCMMSQLLSGPRLFLAHGT